MRKQQNTVNFLKPVIDIPGDQCRSHAQPWVVRDRRSRVWKIGKLSVVWRGESLRRQRADETWTTENAFANLGVVSPLKDGGK